MADSKVSALAAVTDLLDTDDLYLARAGASRRITGESLLLLVCGLGPQIITVCLTSGDDATAVVGRTDKPFKTLSAAIDSANSNSEIKVYETGTETVGTVNAIGVRIEMQAGAILTIATGVTLFEDPQGGPQIYGSGRIILQGTARLIIGTNVNLSLDVNAYTAGANVANNFGIDLTGGVHHICVRSTFTQTDGAAGGAIYIENGSVDIRLGGQVTPTSTSRATPMIQLVTCRGNLETGWNQVTIGSSAAPLYEIGLSGIATIKGGVITAGGTAPFIHLTAGFNVTDEPKLEMYGLVNQGLGITVDHKDGDWAIDVGIKGPIGLGATNAAIACNGAAGSALGIDGYVIAGTSGEAVRLNSIEPVEIVGKTYGNVVLPDGGSVQMRNACIVGQVVLASGATAAQVFGATQWASAGVIPAGITALGVAPHISSSLI